MKAVEFIKQCGWDKSVLIVKNSPKNAQRYFLGKYLKQGEWTWWWSSYVNKWLQFENHIYSDSKFEIATEIKELKKYTDAYELMQKFGGVNTSKEVINSLPDKYQSYSVTRDDTGFSCKSSELQQAITLVEEVGGCDEND